MSHRPWNYGITDWNHVTRHMEGSYGRNGTVVRRRAEPSTEAEPLCTKATALILDWSLSPVLWYPPRQ